MAKALLYYSGAGLILFSIFSCKSKSSSNTGTNSSGYCAMLDTIVYNYKHDSTNAYLTDQLESIVTKTGISTNANFGTFGAIYGSDSLFYDDIKKFRSALNCTGQ